LRKRRFAGSEEPGGGEEKSEGEELSHRLAETGAKRISSGRARICGGNREFSRLCGSISANPRKPEPLTPHQERGDRRPRMRAVLQAGLTLGLLAAACAPALAQDPDVIFKKSTVWRPLTPDDKLVVQGIDDPAIEGVACHYTTPERGGISGTIGVAEEVSDISLACRQVGPVRFKEKLEQGAVVFSERRSLILKRMRIVRAATPSATPWSIWSIRTGRSRGRRRTPPRPCPSCPGAAASRRRAAATA
jgi:CreA protein